MQQLHTVVLIGVLMALSGCIQAIDDGNETTSTGTEPEPQPVQRSASEAHRCEVGTPALPLGDQPVCERYEIEIPAEAFSVEFDLEWVSASNSYSLQVETPGGERRSEAEADDQEIELEVDDVEAGTYTYWPRAESVAFEDDLELIVTYHWMEEVPGDVSVPAPTVRVEQDGNRWRATMHYVAVGQTADATEVAARTINGDMDLVGSDDDESRVDMEVFAWASSEARARELVQAVKVSLAVTTDLIEGRVEEQPRQLDDNEGVGADVVVETPAVITGSASTTNGQVTFDDIAFDDLSVSSTNGGFEGVAYAYGDLDASTTNGGFDIDLVPEASLELELSTTNGGSDIGLRESSAIGYRIEADTTNGEVTEDMDQAGLEGEDNHATLTTSGFDGRSIKVTGSVSTTNGDVHFRGT